MKGIAHKFLHLTNTTNSGNILIKFVATLYNHCLPKCQLVIVFLWTASSIVVEIEHDFMKMVHTWIEETLFTTPNNSNNTWTNYKS